MSPHLDAGELWALHHDELSTTERAAALAHVASCSECEHAGVLAFAAEALVEHAPSVPPLDAALANRVGARLAEAFAAELSQTPGAQAHPSHDALWASFDAPSETPDPSRRAVFAHLSHCERCRALHAEVKEARALLALVPEAPPMPASLSRRVESSLGETLDAQVARRFSSWWQGVFSPKPAFAFAVVLTIVAGAWLSAEFQPRPLPDAPQVASPTPSVTPIAPLPAPAPRTRLMATVSRSSRASSAAHTELGAGSTVRTEKGGSLWMKLPDGSRAGLTQTTELTLKTLDPQTVTLEVARGSVALVVPHRLDRVLTVEAGPLLVKDLGTRFVVNREKGDVVVAVEEGVVEVTSPTGARQVTAGHAVAWRNGALRELDWKPEPEVAAPPLVRTLTPAPVIEQPPSIAKLSDEDDEEEAYRAGIEEEDDEELTEGALAESPSDHDSPVQPPPAVVPTPGKTQSLPPVSAFRPPPKKERFSLRTLERQLRLVGATLSTSSQREAKTRAVVLAGEARDCVEALKLADAWLLDPVTSNPSEPAWRREVQAQRARCLRVLGRQGEADAVLREVSGDSPQ